MQRASGEGSLWNIMEAFRQAPTGEAHPPARQTWPNHVLTLPQSFPNHVPRLSQHCPFQLCLGRSWGLVGTCQLMSQPWGPSGRSGDSWCQWVSGDGVPVAAAARLSCSGDSVPTLGFQTAAESKETSECRSQSHRRAIPHL